MRYIRLEWLFLVDNKLVKHDKFGWHITQKGIDLCQVLHEESYRKIRWYLLGLMLDNFVRGNSIKNNIKALKPKGIHWSGILEA